MKSFPQIFPSFHQKIFTFIVQINWHWFCIIGKLLRKQFAKLYEWNKNLRWNKMNFVLLRVPEPIFIWFVSFIFSFEISARIYLQNLTWNWLRNLIWLISTFKVDYISIWLNKHCHRNHMSRWAEGGGRERKV